MSPDQSRGVVRRAFAGLGLLAALLALSSVAAPLGLLLLGLAAVLLTGWSLFGADRPPLRRFVIVNGIAILLLAWGATERADLIVERTPEQLDVSLNGVRLGASLAGINSPFDRVTVGLGAVEERPVAAPWTFDNLPWLARVGDWLVGGMRGGFDYVRVTDATDASGTDLVPPVVGLWLPDHTADPPRASGSYDAWEPVAAEDGSVALLSPQIASDHYQIAAAIARPSGEVRLTFGGSAPGASVEVVAAADRRHFEVLVRPADGEAETLVGGPFVYRRSIADWSQAILRELGRVWLVALGLVAASRLLAVPFRLTLPQLPAVLGILLFGLTSLLLGLAALTFTSLVALYLLDGMPHTVESIAYLFQAEILALGGLWVPAPILPEFFQQAYVATTTDGRWFGVLPPGQSLLLAAGIWLGAPWLVSPIAAGLAVALTVVLGRLTYGTLVGVVAGLLLLFSPFVLMLSGDMLAHPAGLVLSIVMILAVVTAVRGPATLGWLLAGLAMGGLMLTRPLAAVGIGIPLTVLLVFSGRGAPVRVLLARALLFVLAAAPGVIYAGYVNAALTGSPSLPPLSLWSNVDRIGFGPDIGTRGGHDLASALGNTWANLVVLLRHLFGWPSYLTLALAFVPFVLGSWQRWDRLLLLCLLGLLAAHWLYWSDGIVYGPRYTFEAVAALALLTARGAALLARGDGSLPAETAPVEPKPVVAKPTAAEILAATGAKGAPATLPDGSVPRTTADAPAEVTAPAEQAQPAPEPFRAPVPALSSAPLVVALVAALFAINLVGYMPEVVLAYHDYNGISRAAIETVQAADLGEAVVFVSSDWPNWQAYGQVFLENGPFLDRPIIFARDLGEDENWRLMMRYAERRGWLLRDFELTEIRP